MICRNGKQISKLSNIFGRVVFLTIGNYINPTRQTQIIETESAAKRTVDEQICLSEDQKHTSNVAKIYYQKLRSENIAMKAKLYLREATRLKKILRTIGSNKQSLVTLE